MADKEERGAGGARSSGLWHPVRALWHPVRALWHPVRALWHPVRALRHTDTVGSNPPDFLLRNRQFWRRGWDSNPRSSCEDAGFQDRCNQPLCHLSGMGSGLWRACYQMAHSSRHRAGHPNRQAPSHTVALSGRRSLGVSRACSAEVSTCVGAGRPTAAIASTRYSSGIPSSRRARS